MTWEKLVLIFVFHKKEGCFSLVFTLTKIYSFGGTTSINCMFPINFPYTYSRGLHLVFRSEICSRKCRPQTKKFSSFLYKVFRNKFSRNMRWNCLQHTLLGCLHTWVAVRHLKSYHSRGEMSSSMENVNCSISIENFSTVPFLQRYSRKLGKERKSRILNEAFCSII